MSASADGGGLSLELPARWRPWQRRKNTLIYYGIRLAIALALILPRWLARALGAAVMWVGYWVDVPDRRRAISQLREAIPTIADPASVIRRMFVHFGLAAADWTCIDRLSAPNSPDLDFPADAHAALKRAIAVDKGVLCVAPHLGNWELLAQAVARAGYPTATIAKETYDPRITKLLSDFRERGGVRCLWRGDPEIMRKFRRVFKDKGMLGVLIDQDTKVPSVFVPFFGKPASTPVVPAWVARAMEAEVVFGYCVREGRRYRMHFENVSYARTDDQQADAEALTAELTRLAENAIRQHPSQWVWMHRRWKTQPTDSG